MENILEVTNLSKFYGTKKVVNKLYFRLGIHTEYLKNTQAYQYQIIYENLGYQNLLYKFYKNFNQSLFFQLFLLPF